MKNSILDNEVKVLGETADRDLTSQLQDQLDGMFGDELEQSVVGLKRLIDASSAQLLVLIAELDRRQIPRSEHELSTTAWLMHFCRMTSTEASGTAKTTRSSSVGNIPSQSAEGNTPRPVTDLPQFTGRYLMSSE